MVYKIGLISTHGTGKTTLAYSVAGELKKRGFKVKPIGEIATLASESGIPINQGTTLAAQTWILHKQCEMELEAEIHDYEIIVCDRTVIDNYAYLENALGRNDFCLSLVLQHSKCHPYHRIYFLPITDTPLQEDGIRDTKPDFQQQIDFKLKKLLEEFKVPFISLPLIKSDDIFREEWVRIIIEQTLKDLGRKTIKDFL